MDRFSYLVDRNHRLLLIGIIVLVITAMSAISGEVFEPRRGLVCRTDEPKRFFWNVVTYFLAGVLFIALYFYQRPY